MSAVIIEHVNIADLPASWRAKLSEPNAAQVTVRLETEHTPAEGVLAAADPAFGMWADRADLQDPAAYARQLREPRKLGDALLPSA